MLTNTVCLSVPTSTKCNQSIFYILYGRKYNYLLIGFEKLYKPACTENLIEFKINVDGLKASSYLKTLLTFYWNSCSYFTAMQLNHAIKRWNERDTENVQNQGTTFLLLTTTIIF